MHSTGAISLQTNPAPTYRAQFSFKAQTFRFQDQDDKEDAIWTEKNDKLESFTLLLSPEKWTRLFSYWRRLGPLQITKW